MQHGISDTLAISQVFSLGYYPIPPRFSPVFLINYFNVSTPYLSVWFIEFRQSLVPDPLLVRFLGSALHNWEEENSIGTHSLLDFVFVIAVESLPIWSWCGERMRYRYQGSQITSCPYIHFYSFRSPTDIQNLSDSSGETSCNQRTCTTPRSISSPVSASTPLSPGNGSEGKEVGLRR